MRFPLVPTCTFPPRVQWLLTASVLVGLCVSASHAGAQAIQRCRVDGALVLQNGPCRGGQSEPSPVLPRRAQPVTDNVPSAGPARKKTLADMLRARDGNPAPSQALEAPQDDGALVLRSRMGAG